MWVLGEHKNSIKLKVQIYNGAFFDLRMAQNMACVVFHVDETSAHTHTQNYRVSLSLC